MDATFEGLVAEARLVLAVAGRRGLNDWVRDPEAVLSEAWMLNGDWTQLPSGTPAPSTS